VTDLQDRYLDLLKKTLTHTAYSHTDGGVIQGNALSRGLVRLMKTRGLEPLRVVPTEGSDRIEGRDWPRFAQTMVGIKRLDSLQACVTDVLEQDVPGDLIETGVWRGGASIFMKGVLAAYGDTERTVWVADSFRGLPAPDAERYPADAGSTFHEMSPLAISSDEVRDNFARYGLLDDRVRFLEGWFSETLPALTDERWAIARLDGDMYESVMDSLRYLYPNLSVGGYLIIDDFSIPACQAAVEDYRAEHDITETLETIDWTGRYWRRER
jgi:O-methyltransferase